MSQSLFLATLWSWLMASSFVISAWVTQYASALSVTCLRFLLALIVMTPFFFAGQKRRTEPVVASAKAGWQLALVSGSLVGFFVCLFSALKTTTSLNTSVMYTFIPLIGAIIGAVFSIRTTFLQWMGYACGASGAMLVLFTHHQGEWIWHRGDAIYLAGCLLLAFHVVAVQRWCSRYTAFGGAYRIMLFGTAWLVPVTLLWGELPNVHWQATSFWQMISYLTLGTTLATFVLQQRIVSLGGAKRLLGISYTIPIWVACYDILVSPAATFLSLGLLMGSMLVISALFLIDNFVDKTEVIHGQDSSEKTA